VLVTVFAGVGGLVAARVPRNPLGWLLLCTGLSFAALLFTELLGWHQLRAAGEITDGVSFWLWIATWAWIPAVVPIFIYIPQLFPTGRPLWRWFLLVSTAVVAVFLVASMFATGNLENYPTVPSPFAAIPTAIRAASFAPLIVIAVISLVSLFVRFRRSTGIERQQIKWVFAAGGVLVVAFIGNGVLEDRHPSLAGDILVTGLLAIPCSVAVAILRYRLYDIAVVINRTLVYGSLTAALALMYLASVLLFQFLLAPITSDSGLAVAGSTLAVAAAFRPVRVRIQALVDRRFYRRRYDATVALEAFSARLRDEIDLDSLVGEIGGVLEETMQPAHVSVWLRPRSGARA
jgi:hypothetical protein